VGRAVVVAGSMGGRTAVDLALAHPARVAALALIAPAVSGVPEIPDDEAELPLIEAADAAEEAGEVDEQNRLEAHLWLDGPRQPEGRVSGAARELFLAMNARPLSAADPGRRADDGQAWDRLGKIGVPTLVLVGEHELRYMRELSRLLADAVAGARLAELPGVAHLPQLEADRRTLDEVVAFVGEQGA